MPNNDHSFRLEAGRRLKDHKAEVISLNFTAEGDKLITGSLDKTANIWDVRSGKCVYTCGEHSAEVSNALFDFTKIM